MNQKKLLPYIILSFIYLLLHIISVYFNSALLWGVDQWSYFSNKTVLGLTLVSPLVLFVICFPHNREHILNYFNRVSAVIFKKYQKYLYIIFFLLITVLFWIFRQKTYFLGDGYFLTRLVELKFILRFKEFFDLFLHSVIYKYLHSYIPLNGALTFALVSIMCGIFFLFITLKTAKLLAQKGSERIIIFLLIFFTGMLQLFFGYVEAYTIIALLVTIYCYFAVKVFYQRSSVYPVCIIFSIMIITHISTIAFFPSLLYLVWSSRELAGLKRITHTGLIVLISSLPLFVLIGFLLFGLFPSEESAQGVLKGNHLLPLLYSKDASGIQYPLISFGHLIDILNEFLLLTPVFFVIILSLILNFKSIKSLYRKEIIFLVLILFFYGMEFVVFNKAIGVSRDWDIFSPLAIPVTLAGIIILQKFNEKTFGKIGLILLPVVLLHTIPWILVNASEKKSLMRFVHLTEKSNWSKYAKGYAYDELRYYYSNKNDNEMAFQYAFRAVREGPQDLRLKTNLANQYYLRGDTVEAIVELKEINKIAPDFADAYYHLGLIFNAQNFYGEAIKNFQKAVSLDSLNAGFHYALGNAYLMMNDLAKTRQSYERALTIYPHYVETLINLGMVYLKLGNVEKSVEILNDVVTLRPNNPDSYNNLGLAFRTANRNLEAEEAFKKALLINPNSDMAYRSLGDLYTLEKKFDQAIKAYQAELRINPLSVETYNNLGNVFYEKGKYEEALNMFEKASQINPYSPIVYNNIGNIFYHRNDYDIALKFYQKAISFDPNYYDAMHNLAVVLFHKKQYKQSLQCVKELQKRQYPVDPELIGKLKTMFPQF